MSLPLTTPPRRWRRLAGLMALALAVGLVPVIPALAEQAKEPASDKSAEMSGAKLPPLIDREAFFGDPEISGAQLSPDGKYMTFVKPLEGTRNVWVKKRGEAFDEARPLTNDQKRPVTSYFWTQDSKYVLFVQDKAGDENFNIYAVDPKAKPAEGSPVPEARDLTGMEGVRAMIYAVPETKPDFLYVGLNERDPAWHDLYEIQISTGKKKLLRENTERISGWVFDLEGKLRMAGRLADDGTTEILQVTDEGFELVYTCSVFESCNPIRFHKDNKRVYMVTNKGDDVDLTRLVLFNPKTKKVELVESDPEGRVDFGGPIFSDKTNELIATVYNDERTRIYFRDKAFERDYRWLEGQLPDYEIRPSSSTENEKLWLIAASSDTEPGQTYLFDREDKSLELQYRVFEDLPREHLANMQAISYPSSDGLMIPSFLTLPKGVAGKKLPLLVFPHGGPWARDGWGYDAYAQFFANRGFAVLQPNFRASTGYGKKFLNAGNEEWGDLMQDDITWGVKHLVEKGIADPERVAIMGGSYGGYATLAGVAFTPDLYSAAVAIVAPSNLITLLESIPPYWEAGRVIFHTRMGDPNTEEGRKQLERQSPLNSADKIKTPLLVVQGANDPRVKKAESDQIVVALREREFPVEYIVAPDEGHGFRRPVNNMAMIAASEAFFGKHVGTRYQKEKPADVAKRLDEITVDVATVTMPKGFDPAKVGAPKPAMALKPMKLNYQTTISMGGQEMPPMSGTLEISEEEGRIVASERADTPQGTVTDRTELDPESLILLARRIEQGPVTITMRYAEGTLSGAMAMGGNERQMEVELEGPLFADGAGSGAVIARLPLEVGYKTLFRNFDIQTQKPKVKEAEVVGMEKASVPAGEFETYKVVVASAEGDPGTTTYWVDKDSRKVVKVEAVVPQMNGAIVTSELQP